MIDNKLITSQEYEGKHGKFHAVFISSLSPGYIAGGSQCTLAFAQAISRLHGGNFTYLGPGFLAETPISSVSMRAYHPVGERKVLQKVLGMLRLRSDRITDPANVFLSEMQDFKPTTVVYVNGEAAGSVVKNSVRLGFRTVFIPHNYAPDYLAAEGKRGLLRKIYSRLVIRSATEGYCHADFRILLTRDDRIAYERLTGCRGDCADEMYFGYEDVGCHPLERRIGCDRPFTVLINTNLALKQNEHGIVSFISNVWPALSQKGFNLVVAGRYPTKTVRQLTEDAPQAKLVVRPSPEAMEEIFKDADVCVAATEFGSGIKLRVAEALRRGLPVVSTPHCATGYSHISSEVLRVYTTANEALQHIETLAGSDLNAVRSRCFAEYETHLSFEAGLRRFGKIEDSLIRIVQS